MSHVCSTSPTRRRVVVIGISGASGSGKSTLASAVAADLNSPVSALSMDWFFDGRRIYRELRGNWEEPAALDAALFLSSVKDVMDNLSRGVIPDTMQVKTQSEPLRIAPQHRLGGDAPANLKVAEGNEIPVFLILEGFLLFAFPEVADICTVQLLVTCSVEECCWRRFSRECVANISRETSKFASFRSWFEEDVWNRGYLQHLPLQQRHASRLVSLDSSRDTPISTLVEQVRKQLELLAR